MKPAPFDYVAPDTIEAALEHLAPGSATILAGGQTLMPLLALRMSQPSLIVDINRIAALKGIAHVGGVTRIGAVTRQSELIASEVARTATPALVQAARQIGHLQTRSRGTVGGSIALGEPAAELPACVVALGASLEARSRRGVREISADEFYTGPYATVLEADELLTAIHCPDWPSHSIPICRELARRPGDFALVGLVGAIAVEGGTITRAGLAWIGMGPTPMKARRAEAALVGQTARTMDVAGIAELAIEDTDPFSDHHTTAEYRRTVGRHLFSSALLEAGAVAASAG